MRVWRASALVCWSFATAILMAQSAPQSAVPDARPLTPGAVIRREIRIGETHRYLVALAKDDFVRIAIQQRGTGVRATLRRPDDTDVVVVGGTRSEYNTETVVAIADVNGQHVLFVTPSPLSSPEGAYTISLSDVHPRTAADATRIDAERAYVRGRTLVAPGQPNAYPQAVDEFAAALTEFRRLSDSPGELKTLVELAAMRWALNRPNGLEYALAAETLARDLKDDISRAHVLHIKGLIQDSDGDLDAARLTQQEAGAIHRIVGDRRAESQDLNSEGIVYGKIGDTEKAIACFERSLALSRATNFERGQSLALNNLGIAYKNVGEYERALEVYEEGLALRRKSPDTQSEAFLLYNMGNAQEQLGRFEQAMDLYRRSLAAARSVRFSEMEARSLNAVGRVQSKLGAHAEALPAIRGALDIRRRISDLPGQAASLDTEGRALHAIGDDAGALAALQESITLLRRLGDLQGEGNTLQALAVVARDRGDLASALEYARTAIERDETVRARLTSPQLRTSFVAAEYDKYDFYIDLLQRQHASDSDAGYQITALEVSERARARVLLESMLAGSVDLRQGVDPALLDRERRLQKRLSEASADLSRSTRSGGGDASTTSAADRLERLSTEYEQLQAEIRLRSPHYAAMTQARPLQVSVIQRDVLDDRTVLLEFALGEQRSWLWAVTPTSVWSTPLPARRTIEMAARTLYDGLTARQIRSGESAAQYAARLEAADSRLRTDAAAMSRMLLGGLAERLRRDWAGKRLAIVSGGALDVVPFAALPVPDADDGALLGQAFEIVSLPSASVLHAIREERTGRFQYRRTVAIVADPVFERSDPRVRALRGVSDAKQRSSESTSPESDGRYVEAFARLVFTRREADAIAALAPGTEAMKMTDFKANRATVLDGSLDGSRIIHFATHGILNDARPSLSGLVLSLVDAEGQPQDGYVRLHDIYNLRMAADLVVLSACQTALGKQIRGEGLVGLARAFMYAGAPRVVASLWEVSDVATAELMKRFYRGMLQENLAPAAALHAAQVSMSREPRWRSPYYWAGFVLQGDWR